MDRFKKTMERANLIQSKELDPGSSAALETDYAIIPHYPLYLEKEAPCRGHACLRHCSLCSDSVLTRKQISTP